MQRPSLGAGPARCVERKLRSIADMSFAQSIAYMEAQLGSLRMTRDAAEGLAAFAEKRKPVWTGR